jgi:cellobiose phosphorylase
MCCIGGITIREGAGARTICSGPFHAEYVAASGDTSILKESIPFLKLRAQAEN